MNRLVQLEYGTDIILTTSEHPFYVDNKWVDAAGLRVGDSLYLSSGSKVVLLKITFIDTLVSVLNVTVDEVHNYFVGKERVLVHNNNPCEQAAKGQAR